MDKNEVITHLKQVREARVSWNTARRSFDRNVYRIMVRLLHESARNRMSVHEVADASGLSPKRVRDLMRDNGLNPRDGKTLLADRAAKALHANAELLGVQPDEIDLMSPLAYLPMGEEMRRELAAQRASKVTEIEETTVSGIDYHDLHLRAHGVDLRVDCPVCGKAATA